MESEQDKTLRALQIAIQMEIDGKEYYQKMERASENQLGRELFRYLTVAEDLHRQKFEEIYAAIRNREGWPKIDFQPEGGKRLRTIFARATEAMGSNIKAIASECDAIQKAINMEIKSYDFCKSRVKDTTYDAERDFYDMVAAEEMEHHLVLLDYYEYLRDPAGWFIHKEHPSLDGG
ncbi:MAG: hypothetical protein CL873_01890 [Dehalococcoidales bacterium]|jgi:rubrerythrin|nr:hypothetical protein [Dehalococcoidales bacterium]|tara:strand:+ start:2185 stop:2715 length:531 start_codon:yes stop_codon:yes gene_type:complete